jgi:hypothetical protein
MRDSRSSADAVEAPTEAPTRCTIQIFRSGTRICPHIRAILFRT